MYPDCRTTGGKPIQNEGESPSLFSSQFRHTVGRMLKRYRHLGYQRLAVVFNDTTAKTFSPLYPFDEFDKLVSMGHNLGDWNRESHHGDLKELVNKFRFPQTSRFVVGGYHAKDCVVEMVKVLREIGYEAHPNLLLTNILGEFLLMSHYARKLFGQMHTKEDRVWDRMIYETIRADVESLI